MRLLRVVMMTMVMWLAGLSPALAQNGGQAGPHLAMQLVAESERPKAGDTVTLALATTPAAGWHGYWSNPGDCGLSRDVRLDAAQGRNRGDAGMAGAGDWSSRG